MLSDVVIVGGGISGLSTAYYLGRLGVRSVLLEKSDRLGGLIKTDSIQGCRLEAGPDSYIATKPAVTELAAELGELGSQIIYSNDSARRIFVVREGKLIPLPQGMSMMVPGKWGPALRSELFSYKTKFRFLSETRMRPMQRDRDISVGELVSEHFGEEMLEYIAEPLLSGVYGGEAAHLSARSVLPRFVEYERRYGSLIEGVRSENGAIPKTGLFLSLRDGMQSLTDTLAAAITGSSKVVHSEASSIERSATGWKVRAGADRFEAAQLVLACPAYTGGELLEELAPALAAHLAAIPYSSAILVTLVFANAEVSHRLNGFGFLVPRSERKTIAAATWINTKFPERVAPGLIAIRSFLVGAEAAELLSKSDSELIRLVRHDLQRLMGIRAVPQFSTVYGWPRSMPQYVVGHAERQQAIAQELRTLPSLHLIGNAYDGVGLPDCVRLAQKAAKDIALTLRK